MSLIFHLYLKIGHFFHITQFCQNLFWLLGINEYFLTGLKEHTVYDIYYDIFHIDNLKKEHLLHKLRTLFI